MKSKIEYILFFAVIAGLMILGTHTYEFTNNKDIFKGFSSDIQQNHQQSKKESPQVHRLDIESFLDMEHNEEWAKEIATLHGNQRGMVSSVYSRKIEGKSVWKVKMHDGDNTTCFAYVDMNTGASKRTLKTDFIDGQTEWRSLYELIALYIAWEHGAEGAYFKRPYRTTLEGKNVWQVPVHQITFVEGQSGIGYSTAED